MSSQAKRPTLAEVKRDVTRTRLIDAALTAINEKGYNATTVDDIAAAAGCSRATVYLYFTGKAPIMIALLDRQFPEVIELCRVLDGELAGGIDTASMRARLYDSIHVWSSQPGLLAALHAAMLTDPEVAAWMVDQENAVLDSLPEFFASLAPDDAQRIRERAVILGRMTLAAFSLPHQATSPGAAISNEEEVADYLTELWTQLFQPGMTVGDAGNSAVEVG